MTREIFSSRIIPKWGRETIYRPLFLFSFLKFMWIKTKCSAAQVQYISIVHNLLYNENKLCKSLDYWPRDIANFSFLGKDLGIFFRPHFVYEFLKKLFLKLCFNNWPNLIAWLLLLLDILINMCIAIVC